MIGGFNSVWEEGGLLNIISFVEFVLFVNIIIRFEAILSHIMYMNIIIVMMVIEDPIDDKLFHFCIESGKSV